MFERDALSDGQNDRRQEGSAFLIVVLLTLVVAALGTPMLVMSNTAHQIAANERDAERALFAAKAGVNYGFYLYDQGTLIPTTAGAAFDSYASGIATPLSNPVPKPVHRGIGGRFLPIRPKPLPTASADFNITGRPTANLIPNCVSLARCVLAGRADRSLFFRSTARQRALTV